MNNWKKTTLGEVCEYESQKTSDLDINTYISTENMLPNKGGVVLASNLPNKGTFTKYSNGQTLVSNIRPYFKKIWRADKNGACSNDVLCFKLKDKIIDSFFYYFLNQDTFFEFVMNGAKGTKMPRGDRKHILQFEINLPPLDEQKRIADVLSALDDKIEINNKINENLEAQAQAIFKQWFVDFEFPDSEGKPYKTNGGKFIDSELGEIPEGWKVGTLGDVIENFDSKRKPLSSNIRSKMDKRFPYYGAASLMDYVDDYIFDGIYLLIGEDGTVVNNMGFPILQYVWGKFWVNNHAHVIQGKSKFSVEYIYMLLKNTNVMCAVTGAVQPKINQSNLNSLKIIISNSLVLKEYNAIINPFFNNYRNNIEKNQSLSEIRDSLLPKLMSGEIRV